MAKENRWNIVVPLSRRGRKSVLFAAAQHGLAAREWAGPVIVAGARLALFGDYLLEIADSARPISAEDSCGLVQCVDQFKIAADPHPRRWELGPEAVRDIGARILGPINSLIARQVGKIRDIKPQSNKEAGRTEDLTLSLSESEHKILLHAATTCNTTKRELVQDLLEAAGTMGRVAGLKRQANYCQSESVKPKEIVDTWVMMLVAARCIPTVSLPMEELRSALLDWYLKYRHPELEVMEVDLERPIERAAG